MCAGASFCGTFYEKAEAYQSPKFDMSANAAEEPLVIIFYSEKDIVITKHT